MTTPPPNDNYGAFWGDQYVKQNLVVAGTVSVAGAVTMGDTLSVGGTVMCTATKSMNSLTIDESSEFSTTRTFSHVVSVSGSGASGICVAGDTWLIGTFSTTDALKPVTFTMTHNCHVGNDLESAVFRWSKNYLGGSPTDIADGTWSAWHELPVSTSVKYHFYRKFTFDVRFQYYGDMQLRMRATPQTGYSNASPGLHHFSFTTVGATRFTPSPITPPVVTGGSVTGYLGQQGYEFPAGDQNVPTTNGLFIDASGTCTIQNNLNASKAIIRGYGSGLGYGILMQAAEDTSGPFNFVNKAGGSVGTVATTATGTAYNTTSDYRLKTNVLPLTDVFDKISKLNPVAFTWKSNKESDIGFIAHELGAVVPQALHGEKDAVNADGSIRPQQVDAAKIIPLLTAAIQQLKLTVDMQAQQIQELRGSV